MLLFVDDKGTTRMLAPLKDGSPASAPIGPEAWLQALVMEHPEMLLAGAVSPRHGDVCSICRELPLLSGRADWFGMTPTGEIVLAEVKLGRNGEARREIVAQALEYFSALRGMNYEELEDAARRPLGTRLSDEAGLYEASGAALREDGLAPDEFRERVEYNLRSGRVLLVLLLDRAPASLVRLVAAVFADQPALPFDVAVTECSIYRLDGHGVAVAPRLKGHVVSERRAVVQFDGSGRVTAPGSHENPRKSTQRPADRTEQTFFSELAAHRSGLSEDLRSFLDKGRRLGVVPEVARKMVLRLDGVNMGSIDVHGRLQVYHTEPSRQKGIGNFERYVRVLAEISGAEMEPARLPGELMLRADAAPLLQGMDRWVAALRDWQDAAGGTEAS